MIMIHKAAHDVQAEHQTRNNTKVHGLGGIETVSLGERQLIQETLSRSRMRQPQDVSHSAA